MTHPTCCYYKETVLRRIVVNDFLALQNGFEMNCVPGINLIIGENGTGKSTLMKLIYAVRTSFDTEEYWLGESQYAPPTLPPDDVSDEEADQMVLCDGVEQLKIRQYFDADDESTNDVWLMRGELPKGSRYDDCCEAHIDNDKAVLYFDVLLADNDETHDDGHTAIYIPEKDILSHSKGLLALNTKRTIPFDRTYIDLLSSAELGRIREIPAYMAELLKKLAQVSGGEVLYQNDQFYIKKENGTVVPFSYEASGLKRFGLLWQLIQNGQIQSGNVLFWDEPDNSLNPKLMSKLAEVLMELSRHQIQIFIATHNETLARCLALHRKGGDSLMFHAMYRDDDQNIKVYSTREFEQLQPNSLTDARVKLYDAEMAKAFGNE